MLTVVVIVKGTSVGFFFYWFIYFCNHKSLDLSFCILREFIGVTAADGTSFTSILFSCHHLKELS